LRDKLERPVEGGVARVKSFVKLLNVVVTLAGCAHVDDDLPLAPLAAAIDRDAAILERGSEDLQFGPRKISRARYAEEMRALASAARQGKSELLALIESRWGRVEATGPMLVTSYYEPTVRGAHQRSEQFSQPLYSLPPPELRNLTREEIDLKSRLSGHDLELAWVDPFDAFVLQVEGSGRVDFGESILELDFAATNEKPHVRLGPFLPSEARKDMPSMESYFRSLPRAEMMRLLANDPRYTFFQPRRSAGPKTKIGVAAVDGRTIAIDGALPHAVVGYLETTAPDGKPLRRLVLAEDTGGGIKGARVDLFWGRDEEAKRQAGRMKQKGRLFFLVPRDK
jgi:membrane-bound lytic murein transglycosylase A